MEHSSNSLILKNILDNETCELKQMIDNFMYEKLKEFQEQIKTNVDKVVTERINTFYNPPCDELDEVVFDDDCINVKNIPIYHGSNQRRSIMDILKEENNPSSPRFTGINKEYVKKVYQEILKLEGQKCFKIIEDWSATSNGITTRYLYIFKSSYITESYYPSNNYNPYDYRFSGNHSLPIQTLYAIKCFSPTNTLATKRCTFDVLQKAHTEHPHYFQPNCIEFEQICQREYAQIEKTKEEFEELTEEAHRILDENTSKKDYYDILDQRLEQIAVDEARIKEEKQKLLIVKERLLEMKTELERERQEFEEEKRKYLIQKNKSIDIDKCFEDLL
jgi:hypothetical protein